MPVAYAHGFLSSAQSSKGRFLRERLAPRGVDVQLLTLNGKQGPAGLSPQSALAALSAHWREAGARPLTLIGSSFGGWAISRFAELHPERVDRLMLLNPGFELGSRWDSIVGREGLATWERDGWRTFAMPSTGDPVQIPYTFVEQTRVEGGMPAVRVPTCILHGRHDDVVPWQLSESFASRVPCSKLVLLEDDHALTAPASLNRIADEAVALCETPRAGLLPSRGWLCAPHE